MHRTGQPAGSVAPPDVMSKAHILPSTALALTTAALFHCAESFHRRADKT